MSQPGNNWKIDVDEKGFGQQVLAESHRRPVLVDIWADWCSPCLVIAPALDRVLQEFNGALLLAKVDADDNMRIAGRYHVRGFPTCILFRDGEEVARFSGAKPVHVIREFIEEHSGLRVAQGFAQQ